MLEMERFDEDTHSEETSELWDVRVIDDLAIVVGEEFSRRTSPPLAIPQQNINLWKDCTVNIFTFNGDWFVLPSSQNPREISWLETRWEKKNKKHLSHSEEELFSQ